MVLSALVPYAYLLQTLIGIYIYIYIHWFQKYLTQEQLYMFSFAYVISNTGTRSSCTVEI